MSGVFLQKSFAFSSVWGLIVGMFRYNFVYISSARQRFGPHIIVLFVETPRKFITAVINLRGVSTNKTIIYVLPPCMQTYKELIRDLVIGILKHSS